MKSPEFNPARWSQYVSSALDRVGGVSNKDAADALGLSAGTVGNWINEVGSQPGGVNVCDFARFFCGGDVWGALWAAGYIADDERPGDRPIPDFSLLPEEIAAIVRSAVQEHLSSPKAPSVATPLRQKRTTRAKKIKIADLPRNLGVGPV